MVPLVASCHPQRKLDAGFCCKHLNREPVYAKAIYLSNNCFLRTGHWKDVKDVSKQRSAERKVDIMKCGNEREERSLLIWEFSLPFCRAGLLILSSAHAGGKLEWELFLRVCCRGGRREVQEASRWSEGM